MSVRTLYQALSEEQMTIMSRGERSDYSLEQSIADMDLIADITELKMKLEERTKANREGDYDIR